MRNELAALSLVVNIAVLIPVSLGLLRNAAWARAAFGERTPARGILLSIYLAILAASVIALAWGDSMAVTALLGVQVLYKVTTPFSVGTLRHPVVASNLIIAVLHAIAITSLRS